jgi:hypothetical protein
MIDWYLNRLKTFSIAEFPYRVGQYVQKTYEQYFHAGKSVKKQKACDTNAIPGFDPSFTELFPDSISVFGKSFTYSDNSETDWHRDIFSGESFPQTYSKNINIRSNPALSAKYVWEVNRLQFLPHIAFNYRKSKDEIFLNRFMSIVSSWIESNPYLLGVNWYSNIEINIRLINWFICWQALDVEKLCTENAGFKTFVEEKWLPEIYLHCGYSYKNPSKFSSANNHLIAEYSGLFIASSLWKFKESPKWQAYSREGLEKEIQRQHSSGIDREEAAEYIQFITDFFLFPYLIAIRVGKPFSKSFEKTLYEIFLYINNFLDCDGNFPKYGDEDDGRCFIFDTDEGFNNFLSLLTSAAIIFNDRQFKRKNCIFDLKNLFFFGDDGKTVFESLPLNDCNCGSVFYKDQGHFIFRKTLKNKEIYLHFDAAPLGFLSIAAHGHADALSFILHINGNPFFIDSGTYTYHTEPEWRKYFVGTLAHNTVRINKHDQALSGGPTLWLNHFRTTVTDLESGAEEEIIRAEHDGYKKEKIKHSREIIFRKLENVFEINDTIFLRNEGSVYIEIPFHLHPNVCISNAGTNNYSLKSNNECGVELTIDEKLNSKIIKGQLFPQILGWYSESFSKKVPANVIFCTTEIRETTTYKFVIKID